MADKDIQRTAFEEMLVLSVLAVMYAATSEELDAQLNKSLTSGTAEKLLASLVTAGRVRELTTGGYVLTHEGYAVFRGSRLGKKRDIQRMYYLTERSKRG